MKKLINVLNKLFTNKKLPNYPKNLQEKANHIKNLIKGK
tara:strand:- start:365 stop:481 length:117 start_codon:yes stop_codon:yes gene_type:complete